ncbi:alpha-1,2 glucosyltransferase ALG10 [Pyricularia oryzae Y34]|uniref:Dol-P-Glc:Glc(2)Man(9)GlcNAc(2)-PP-Dol alpha-1,2-glucosyltransferase n=2 Tax=Pyricularia oryzae TaxID=318829 RepID=A0AA97PLI1_PYRO3|nr:alpha-1,2 glucosyltransferase ALG10 [Pyricularia oryzae Y34]
MGLFEMLPVSRLVHILVIYAASFAITDVMEDSFIQSRRLLLNRFIYRTGLFLVIIAACIWLAIVNTKVPEPYLDEVFHIPQAEKYLQGRWVEWDDKITTPPGLYLVSYVLVKARTWLSASAAAVNPRYSQDGVTAASLLRESNVYAVMAIAALVLRCRRFIETRHAPTNAKGPHFDSMYSIHTTVNITLFPVIFFFSGLYYTDLWSTATVLWAYENHLKRLTEQTTFWNDINTVILGVTALFMRQTNVFWVVVYFGGLESIHAIKKGAGSSSSKAVKAANIRDLAHALETYWALYAAGNIHDPPLSAASTYDVVWLVLSVAIAAVHNLPRVLRQVWPHISILGLFAGFVAWNGGVVLVSTALYLRKLLQGHSAQPQKERSTKSSQKDWTLTCIGFIQQHTSSGLPFPLWYVSAAVATVIVHKSTIIHPFTLADNRHYMFYVFRYSILRRPEVRYLLVPFYVVCHRLCWHLLGGSSTQDGQRISFIQAPGVETVSSAPPKDTIKLKEEGRPEDGGESLSTGVLWLSATALSLITAPLVEPRYFIVPWVMWRIMVPAWRVQEPRSGEKGLLTRLRSWTQGLDLRLVLETLWFVAINLGTMYMFICRPYHWKDVDGKLMDEGRLQRFMW